MMLEFLYQTVPGRMVLKQLTRPGLSRTVGRFMDSRFSKPLIPFFIRQNGIDVTQFEDVEYPDFNSFFCRKIRPELRPIDQDPKHFIAPCDGYLSTYAIQEDLVIPVKNSRYRISDLLQDKDLAAEYDGGTCLVFRLCVQHYHRYGYPDHGTKEENHFIPGKLHTVRPIALRNVPVFTENAREYTILHTENFGDLIQMEVGAMLVGKIRNLHEKAAFQRGEEKGHFLYGGSTVILLVKKDQARFIPKLYTAAMNNKEVPVQMGQVIGYKQ